MSRRTMRQNTRQFVQDELDLARELEGSPYDDPALYELPAEAYGLELLDQDSHDEGYLSDYAYGYDDYGDYDPYYDPYDYTPWDYLEPKPQEATREPVAQPQSLGSLLQQYHGAQSTREPVGPFSWLSTGQVCQQWQAHFAAYPQGQ